MARDVIDHEGLSSPENRSLREMAPPPGLPFRIGRIGHVVLKVADLARSVDFYTRNLGFRVSDAYPDSMMPGGMVFLRCNADHHGVALVGGANEPATGNEFHHMAFEVATLDEVVRARDHLRANGIPIDFEGRRRAGCQVAVEFRDPDGHCLEIYWGLDQIGSGGEVRPPEEWRAAATLEAAIADPPPGQDTTLLDPTLQP